jgi:hypothetical protein
VCNFIFGIGADRCDYTRQKQPLHAMFCGANALGQTERVPLGRLSDRFRCFGWYRHWQAAKDWLQPFHGGRLEASNAP